MKVPGAADERDAGESDWDDQDLLTLDEAGHRLQQEIDETRALLSAPEGVQPALQRRLDALLAAQRRNAARRSAQLPT